MFSYNCPTDTGFSSQKFEVQISRLYMDADDRKRLTNKSLATVEKEVARSVLKNVEHVLECFELGKKYTQEELIDALALVRRGYDL